MRSTYRIKKGRQLVQVEWKWCDELSRDNLKHKLYMTCNIWEEAPLPSLYYILCLSARTTSKCHFSLGFPSGSPKTKTLIVPKISTFISFSNQVYFDNTRVIFYSFKKIFPIMYNTPQSKLIWPLLSRGFWSKVKFSIWFPPFF